MAEEKFQDLKIYVQTSPFRCFSDEAYALEGIQVTEDLSHCDILMGVKGVDPEKLIPGKTYLFFSHTIKKQSHNLKLLKALLKNNNRLVDYEVLTDDRGVRIIGFGRWAGLIGSYLGVRAYCIRRGLSPFQMPFEAGSLAEMIRNARVYRLPPLKIVITGDGRVSSGACEMMDAFRIRRVTPGEFIDGSFKVPVYAQLNPGEYNKTKDGSPFELQHFFNHPEKYKGDFNKYSKSADLLIAAAYWDPRAPKLFMEKDITDPGFRLSVIADISCDLNGSIPSTIQTTSFSDPYYDYDPGTGKACMPFSDPANLTVMAIDNLPCGLPKESSVDFGLAVIKNILPLLIYGDRNGILKRATITFDGELTAPFEYLHGWVTQSEQHL